MTGAERDTSITVPESLGVESLKAFIKALEATPTRGVLLLGGGAATFCRGMSLTEISLQQTEELQSSLSLYEDCLWRLRTAPVTTICVVQGEALGGGLGLAAASDIIIATERARFGLPEALFGLLPGMVLPLLSERISAQRLRRLALTCESIDAQSALSIGLIDELVSEEALPARLSLLCKRLRRVSSESVRLLKQYTTSTSNDLRAALREGRQLTSERLQDQGVIRRMSLFMTEGLAPWENQ